jgi:hypothetical protein
MIDSEFGLPNRANAESIIYMNDPFSGRLFAQALANLVDSVDRRPRRIRLIYRAPREQAQLDADPRLRLARSRGRHPDRRLVMYEIG